MIEIRIGVSDSTKELTLEVDDKPESISKVVEQALGNGSGMFWITDRKGRRVGVPSAKLTYVEIDPETSPRSVGFGR